MSGRSKCSEAEFRKMWRESASVESIAKALGITPVSVYQRSQKLGLPKKPWAEGGRRRKAVRSPESPAAPAREAAVVNDDGRTILRLGEQGKRSVVEAFKKSKDLFEMAKRLGVNGEMAVRMMLALGLNFADKNASPAPVKPARSGLSLSVSLSGLTSKVERMNELLARIGKLEQEKASAVAELQECVKGL
jgi:hypothetical protein